MKIASATRAFPGEIANGDLAAVTLNEGAARLALIDGLGHGPEAATAAETAGKVLTTHPNLSPTEALRLCHVALRGTRGAAISVIAIDPAADHLVFAGVGNVDARLWSVDRTQQFIPNRGIVGATLPTIRPIELDLPRRWRLLMYSDGVSGRFDWSELADLADADPLALAEAVLARRARDTDDATVIAVLSEG